MKWKISFRHKLSIVFGAGLVILGGLSTLSYSRVRQDRDDQEWVERTHNALETLDAYQTDLAGATARARGYAVNGDAADLQEYRDAAGRLTEEETRLRGLVSDEPRERASLDALAPLVSARMQMMEERARSYHPQARRTPPAPGEAAATRESNRQVQALLAEMKTDEQKLLQDRLQAAAESGLKVRLVMVFGNALAFLFLIIAGTAVAREGAKRDVAEKMLRQSETRFRLMVANVKGYAIFTLDRQGRVASWNAGAAEINGYQAEEIMGRHFSVFYPPEALAEDKPAKEISIAAQQGAVEDEGWRVRKDGSRFWANVTLTALRDESGKLRGFCRVARDMTERKNAEREMELRNAQLEAANRELEQFSYSVSHDLRAPLRGIDGFSQALLEDYADRLDERGRNYLDRVRGAAQTMAQLIDDLLRLARISRSEIRHEAIDLSALARSVAEELTIGDPSRGVEFVIPEGLCAEGDAQLIRTVLENLIGNSWKFTSKLPAARIELGHTHKNGANVLFVRDNGAGFDPAHATRLFGAFQRLHLTTEFPGTGIGLASVQRIIHRHGGRVWAESQVGQGATFYFILPGIHTRTEELAHAV